MLVSGRHMSRAWLSVAGAASDDDARPAFYRAVRVEEYFAAGVRLIATDSYWLARCWVPAAHLMDDISHTEPPLEELPDRAVTIRDEEYRLRDLMKHVAKATRKTTAPVIEIRLDLNVTTYDDDRPTLTPEMAETRVRVEIPDERIMARIVEGEWPDWRGMVHEFRGAKRTGATITAMSAWMLTALGKVAVAGACDVIGIEWIDGQRATWTGENSGLDFAPSGLFMAVRRSSDPPDDPTLDDVAA